jgi:hypothetical protein
MIETTYENKLFPYGHDGTDTEVFTKSEYFVIKDNEYVPFILYQLLESVMRRGEHLLHEIFPNGWGNTPTNRKMFVFSKKNKPVTMVFSDEISKVDLWHIKRTTISFKQLFTSPITLFDTCNIHIKEVANYPYTIGVYSGKVWLINSVTKEYSLLAVIVIKQKAFQEALLTKNFKSFNTDDVILLISNTFMEHPRFYKPFDKFLISKYKINGIDRLYTNNIYSYFHRKAVILPDFATIQNQKRFIKKEFQNLKLNFDEFPN